MAASKTLVRMSHLWSNNAGNNSTSIDHYMY